MARRGGRRISGPGEIGRRSLCWLVPLWLTATLVGSQPTGPPRLEGADPMVAERLEEAWRRATETPDDAALWRRLGMLYHAVELTENAVECYRRATELAPAEPRAHYLAALALAELGETEGALEAVDRAIELAPSYVPAHWRRGGWLASLGRSDESEASYRRAVEIDPAAAAAWIGLATLALERGRPHEVIDMLGPVLAADRTNGVAGQLYGRALLETGDRVTARRVLGMTAGMGAYFPDPWHEEVVTSVTGVLNILQLLGARMDRGDVDGAIAELEKLRRSHPEHVGVLNKLSEGYLQRGQIDRALEVLETALELDPNEFATLAHLAQAERFRGNLQAALGWTDRALEANPRLWQIHFERAAIFHRASRFDDCLEALASAMRYGAHQNPNAWLMQGDVQIRIDAWEDAAATFRQASERFPFLGQAWVGLALAEVELGRIAEAKAALEVAGQLQEQDATMVAVEARIRELERAGDERP